MKKVKFLWIGIALLVIAGGIWYWWSGNEKYDDNIDLNHVTPEEPTYLYGIAIDSFEVEEHTILKNEFLSTIFAKHGVNNLTVHQLVQSSEGVFNVKDIRVGNPYTTIKERDSAQTLAYLIYHPNLVDYIVFNLKDSAAVTAGQKEVTTEIKEVAGEITSSLYEALIKGGANANLAMKMADMYAWTIDFYSIQKGDKFKVIYEQQLVDGSPLQIGNIHAAVFEHKGVPYYGYRYQVSEDKPFEYYNEKGESLRRAFLKAPLKFSRISSRFSLKRFHPVQKRWKAHLGTDYAAPHGTPIIATGSGTVIASEYNGNNGHYVKIKHNTTYTTQYLHMSRRAVKVGQRISQGQVIGYVGSTGLATGPHVCYRFWKNGQQVDPLREKFPTAEPITKTAIPAFEAYRLSKDSILNRIEIKKAPISEEMKAELLKDSLAIEAN
ncbi:M23 family metallopeptidase [Gynurincola endophyticus]|uniref:M23 family metallopeptidase n=1 Tax=Gynurincola endophyticus TaxID=2479004 RepID=UPI000F8E98C5|nr:peptidoglycan DD-metalloendopeptidase family protein [Gynurincola endophyticus]